MPRVYWEKSACLHLVLELPAHAQVAARQNAAAMNPGLGQQFGQQGMQASMAGLLPPPAGQGAYSQNPGMLVFFVPTISGKLRLPSLCVMFVVTAAQASWAARRCCLPTCCSSSASSIRGQMLGLLLCVCQWMCAH